MSMHDSIYITLINYHHLALSHQLQLMRKKKMKVICCVGMENDLDLH